MATAPADDRAADSAQELTDGFHLVIDALKLNGIETIYHVPGIPVTDLGRMAQAEGLRVISFRHETNAGNAAAIAGYLTKKPGVCLTVSAPGFLNGLVALSHATTNCWPMILISGRVRARDRRPAAGRLRGDGPAGHRQAALQGRLSHPARAGHRHRRRAGDPGGAVGAAGRRLSRRAGQAAGPGHRRGRGRGVAGQGDRPGAGAVPVAAGGRPGAGRAEGREAAADHPRQGRGLCPVRRAGAALRRDHRHPLHRHVDGQGPAARRPPAICRRRALAGAEGRGLRHAGRRAAELAAQPRQGQGVGRARLEEVRPHRHRPEGDGFEPADRRRRWSATSRAVSTMLLDRMEGWQKPSDEWTGAIRAEGRRERRQDGAAAAEQQRADGLPRRARPPEADLRRSTRTRSWSTRAPTRSISPARSSTWQSRASGWTSAPGA